LTDQRQETEPTGDESFASVLATLSPRETEVLRGVVDGKANKVIAYELGISPRTVEVYRANVMAKTGAKGLPELVRMAMSAGF
jgi:two-component system response regulator FixJ